MEWQSYNRTSIPRYLIDLSCDGVQNSKVASFEACTEAMLTFCFTFTSFSPLNLLFSFCALCEVVRLTSW